ncbi:unnamed protein product [Peniophora sp. CBMAI 1063]|nr:unnamed protein product [Peniophora sp. CBMAI 1063]
MSPPFSDATPIPLQPFSLYIALVQIPIPDKFHWALYITDAHGLATCHQWTEHVGALAQGKAEGYKIDVLPLVTDMAENYVQNIAFIRLGAYVSPSAPPSQSESRPDNVDVDLTGYMTRLFDGIFEGYATIFENRKKGVTCRTWLMRALERLRTAGHLPGLDKDAVAAYEHEAIEVGKRAEVPVEVEGGHLRIVTAVTFI